MRLHDPECKELFINYIHQRVMLCYKAFIAIITIKEHFYMRLLLINVTTAIGKFLLLLIQCFYCIINVNKDNLCFFTISSDSAATNKSSVCT